MHINFITNRWSIDYNSTWIQRT